MNAVKAGAFCPYCIIPQHRGSKLLVRGMVANHRHIPTNYKLSAISNWQNSFEPYVPIPTRSSSNLPFRHWPVVDSMSQKLSKLFFSGNFFPCALAGTSCCLTYPAVDCRCKFRVMSNGILLLNHGTSFDCITVTQMRKKWFLIPGPINGAYFNRPLYGLLLCNHLKNLMTHV